MRVAWENLADGDPGIQRTLAVISAQASAATRDPFVVQAARRIVAQVDGRNLGAVAAALARWFHEHYRFVRDPLNYELVVAPRRLLEQLEQQGYFQGDCDDGAVLFAALAQSLGIPTRFRVLSRKPPRPGDRQFTHVLIELGLAGRWVPFDPTMPGSELGERPPVARSEATYEEREPMYQIYADRLGQAIEPEWWAPTETYPAYDQGNGYARPIELPEWPAVPEAPNPTIPESTTVPMTTPVISPTGPTGPGASWITDVGNLFTRVTATALPFLERYGVLSPVLGPSRLPLPGEPRVAYMASLPEYRRQLAQVGTTVMPWVLLGGGALVLLMMMPRGRRR